MPKRYSDADLEAMVSLYLDGELEAADQAAVEAFLARRPDSYRLVAEAARLIDALDEAIAPRPLDDAFDADLAARLAALRPAQRLRQRLSLIPPVVALRLAGELALVLMLAVLLWLRPWAPPVSNVECQLLGEATWTLGQPVGVRLIVRERGLHRPIAGADVSLRLGASPLGYRLLDAKTNEQGAIDATPRLPDGLRAGDYTLWATVDSASGETVVRQRVRLVAATALEVVPVAERLPAGRAALLAVDARDAGTGAPLADATADWRLTDASQTVLAAGRLPLTDHGRGLLRVATSEHLPPGAARLTVDVAGTRQQVDLAIDPSDAAGPSVEIRPEADYVVSGHRLRGEAIVRHADGRPLPGASCRAKLVVEGREAVASGAADSLGRWRFRMWVPPTDRREGTADLLVEATGPDGAVGRARRGLTASRAGLWLDVAPRADRLVPGVENLLRVTARYPDGRPRQGPVRLQLAQGTNRGETALWTDARGEALVRWTPREGPVRAFVSAPLDRETIRRWVELPTAGLDDGLLVRTARTAVSPGDAMRVEVVSPGPAREVYLDLLSAGETVATRSLNLASRQGSVVLHLPERLREPVCLRAYAPRPGGGWRTGGAGLRLEPAEQLTIEADPAADPVRLVVNNRDGEPVTAELAIIEAPEGSATAGVAEPVVADPPRFSLSANSTRQAQQRAVATQRRFFQHSPLLGCVAGSILLGCAVLWAWQILADPFEVVRRAERAAWGAMPAVHRRGRWAGYGIVAAGLGLALLLAAGLVIAGSQARRLAAEAQSPTPAWRVLPADPVGRTVATMRDLLRRSPVRAVSSSAAADVTARLVRAAGGRAEEVLADRTATRRLLVQAVDEAGRRATADLTVPPSARVETALRAPSALRVGDRLAVPLTVVNPTDRPWPVRIDAAAGDGLELASAPTRRVVAPPGESLFGLPVRAAEAGAGWLEVNLTGRDLQAAHRASVEVTPRAARLRDAAAGTIAGAVDIPLDLPAGAVAPQLVIELHSDTTAGWDRSLSTVLGRPAFDGRDVAARLAAAALRVHLRRSADQPVGPPLIDAVQVAYQHLLALEVRIDGRPTGGFSPTPGGSPTGSLTAAALSALDAARAVYPVDDRLLDRVGRWLTAHAIVGGGAALDDRPDQRLELRARLLAAGSRADDDQISGLLAAAEAAPDAYALAWCVAALRAQGGDRGLAKLEQRLAGWRQMRLEGSGWTQAAGATPSGATGPGATTETTALATLALAESRERRLRAVAADGARLIAARQLADGTWGSAEATTLAVAALAATAGEPAAGRGTVTIDLDGARLLRDRLTADRRELVAKVSPEPGARLLKLRFSGRGRPSYRVAWSYSRSEPAEQDAGLRATVTVDRAVARRGETVTATVTVTNTGDATIPALAAELPVPAGFAASAGGSQVTLAVGGLAPGDARSADLPLRVVTPRASLVPAPAEVWAVRNPTRRRLAEWPALEVR